MLVLPHTPCARDHTTFGPPEFIPSATYAPQGSLASAVLSVYGSFAGITVTSSYNKRLQPVEIKASSSAGTEMDLTYNFSLGAGDNGNVMSITNNLNTARSQAFSYDALNRLVTSQTSGTAGSNCFGFQFGYDQWANLKSTSVLSGYTSCTATTPYAFGIAVGTNNRVTTSGFGYDLSGNLTSDGINAYTWNAESETKTAAGVTYIYDGDGNRVEKSNGTLYWYGLGGEVLEETSLTGADKNDYVFFNGRRVALKNSSGSDFYYAEDHLGSSRVMFNASGGKCYDADFLPFGQEVDYTNTCGSNYKFEGKERDTETGNDNFGARYYRSLIGRWQSPDWSAIPAPVPYANLTNPQTLNLYAMTSDNPETFADLDGHDWRDVVLGIGQGLRNFAVDTGAGLRTAVEHPSTIVTGTVTSLETAGHAYFTSAGRSQLAGQFSSLSTQGKTALITEALTQGVAAAALTKGVGAATKALSGAGGLSDSALVVRGGVPTAAQLTKGAETIAPDGTLSGVSVNSANGATVEQLSAGVPNNQIGVTTVGDIRGIGGDVTRDSLGTNPNHCLMCNVDASQASKLFKVQPNPAKVTVRPQ